MRLSNVYKADDMCRDLRSFAVMLAAVTLPAVLLVVAAPSRAGAQRRSPNGPPQPTTATGTVTGRILCADTQRPARFAEVMLSAVTTEDDSPRGGARLTGRTDLDGTFSMNPPPGDYYATGSATGYVNQAGLIQAAAAGNADAQAAVRSLPVVHVSAGVTSTVNISIERGAVIAGRVAWDDGSPAAGVQIGAVAQTAASQTTTGLGGFRAIPFPGFGAGFAGDTTDDRGRFRLSGLSPGTYLLRVTILTPTAGGGSFMRMSSLQLYAPGKVRKMDALAITVSAGEEHEDVPFLLDLRSLHRISGHVGAVSGGVEVGSGVVRLVDSQDSSLTRAASIGADGNFTLAYVPDGNYTLSVPSAGPVPVAPPGRGGRNAGDQGPPTPAFQPFQETLTVADNDIAGLHVELTPATAATAAR